MPFIILTPVKAGIGDVISGVCLINEGVLKHVGGDGNSGGGDFGLDGSRLRSRLSGLPGRYIPNSDKRRDNQYQKKG